MRQNGPSPMCPDSQMIIELVDEYDARTTMLLDRIIDFENDIPEVKVNWFIAVDYSENDDHIFLRVPIVEEE